MPHFLGHTFGGIRFILILCISPADPNHTKSGAVAKLAIFFKPDPLPMLTWPAVGPGGPKIDRELWTRMYMFHHP